MQTYMDPAKTECVRRRGTNIITLSCADVHTACTEVHGRTCSGP